MTRQYLLSLTALLAFIAVASASLEVSVRIDKSEIIAGSPLLARVSILNPLDTPVTVLTWFNPLEGARSDMFRLVHSNGGLSALYTGMLLKRQFPAPIEAYTTFAAGEVRHIVIPLHDSYHFTTSGAHEITLVAFFNGFIGDVAKLDSEQFDFELEVVSTPIRVAVQNASVDALFSRIPVGIPQTLHADAITYNGCSSTQTTGIKNALPIAQSDATQAYNYLVAAKCNGNYVTWFGTSTSSRYSTVQTHFQKIVAQLKSNNYKFDCTCNQAGVFAYVYPYDPSFTVYLCPAFWTAPTGSHQYNSRPGTLTHETSHFKAVAGTDDIQYGEVGCKRLAQSSPNDAVKNADSHEYFQESNPRC